MDGRRIEILLPAELAGAAQLLAREADITVGQLVRDLLAREVGRRARSRPPARADERLVAPLRARLAGDLAYAAGWDDLQARLRAKGYILREAGGGLALHDWPADRRLCKASELGFSHGRLARRFGAPFPGRTAGIVPPTVSTGPAPRLPLPAPVADGPEADDDDIEVIEPFD
jgi:hypothetical protein